MILQTITINNFKNLKHEVIELSHRYELRQRNGFGKTSIADAITWVLTGKLSNGSSDLTSIKPKDDTRALVSVELKFDNGTSLKKSYCEKWTRTRGTTIETLSGHETKCYINEIEIPVSKYDDELLELFKVQYNGKWNGNIIQLILDPLFFGMKLEWQDRRRIVIDLVGDVTDEDVFLSQPYLRPLQKHLEQHKGKFENVKKSINLSKSELLKQEISLNAQIEVLSNQTVSEETYNKTVAEISTIEYRVQTLINEKNQSELQRHEELRSKTVDLKIRLSQSKEQDLIALNEQNKKVNDELNAIRNNKQNIQNMIYDLTTKIQSINNDLSKIDYKKQANFETIKDLSLRKQRLANEWQKVNAEVFVNNHSLICPNCQFDLHAEDVKKSLEKFNLRKANTLKDIQEQGQAIKKQIEDLQTILFDSEYKTLEDSKNTLQDELQSLKDWLQAENTKEYIISSNLLSESKSINTIHLQDELNALLNANTSPVLKDYAKEVEILRESQKPHQTVINQYNAEQMNLRNANNLKNELKKVVNQIAEYESLLGLLTDFIKTKLELLNQNVSRVFGSRFEDSPYYSKNYIEFQLVENNIKEGSWNEVCYVLDNGVPYHNTNSASKITLGIAVCEAIRKHLNIIGLPYIIDNAEQITNRNYNTLEQTISFVADDEGV